MSQSGLRLNSRVWPLVVGGLLLLQLLSPFRGWLMLLIGLGGLWLASWLWARSLRRGLSITREMRYGWAQVGDQLEERFNLENSSLLPAVWVELHDESTIPGYSVSRATGVAAGSLNSWLTHQVCSRRGLFTLGPTRLVTGDPFGIYSVTLRDEHFATILVTPPILPLPHIQVASGGRSGDGRPTRAAVETTQTTAGVRGYAPGDRLSRIHWPTTARRSAWYVKTFDNTPASDWWIILDLDQAAQTGSGASSTEEAGVILAASLADRGLRAGLAVGLIATSQPLIWLPARTGEAQRWEILRALAAAEPGNQPLEETLARAGGLFRSSSSLVLITPRVDAAWVQPLLTLVWKGIIPTVILLDPLTFDGAASAAGLEQTLAELEIARYIITADMLNPQPEHPEELNRWDWRILPTGKAVPVQRPRETQWKSLS